MGYLMFWSNEPMNTQMAKTQPISPRDQIITARAVVSEQIFIKVDALQLNEAMIHHVAHCVHVVNAIEHWFCGLCSLYPITSNHRSLWDSDIVVRSGLVHVVVLIITYNTLNVGGDANDQSHR
eukprot:516105_1